MGKKIQVDELEYKRLLLQDKKISALLDSQRDLNLAMKDLVGYFKIRDKEMQLDAAEDRNVVITVEGGCVVGVEGLPSNWTFQIDDKDALDEEFTPEEEMEDITDDSANAPWKQGYNGQ